MFDDLDIDWNIAGISFLMYCVCLLLVWKFFDQQIMKLYIKIIMSIVMLPICYLMTYWIANK